MTPHGLLFWRERLGLKRQEAADALGISLGAYSNYERGVRYNTAEDAQEVKIPKSIGLACAAIALGVDEYDGEEFE